MTTILQITPAYKPAYIYGGPTLSVSKLCEELHKTNFDIKVLTTTANGSTELQVLTNRTTIVAQVKVKYFKRLTKDHTHFSPALLLELIRLIKQHKEIAHGQLLIHIHSWWNTVAISSCLISRLYKIPVVLSPRGMLTEYTLNNRNGTYKRFIHYLLGKSLLKYCHIHATTTKEEMDIRKITTNNKEIHIIPNFVNYPKISLTDKLTRKTFKDPVHLLFLSRVEEKKGLDILLNALSYLDFEWQLTIAGKGESQYMNRLQKLSKHLNNEHSITWLGEVNNTEKFNILKNNDLLILPSHNENFANVVIESLSMGTAVVITKEVGLADYVIQNNLGWIAEPFPQSLAEILNIAAADFKKREWIRKKAPAIIKKDFLEEKLNHKYTSMYNLILKNVN